MPSLIDQDYINSQVYTPEFENALKALPQESKTKFIRVLTQSLNYDTIEYEEYCRGTEEKTYYFIRG